MQRIGLFASIAIASLLLPASRATAQLTEYSGPALIVASGTSDYCNQAHYTPTGAFVGSYFYLYYDGNEDISHGSVDSIYAEQRPAT